MARTRRTPSWLAASTCLFSLLLAQVGLAAQGPEPARALHLDAAAEPGLPDPATLQLALEHELGLEIRTDGHGPGDAVLTVRSAGNGQATVGFAAPDGRKTGRTVHLPGEQARAAETIALLAANLVRDEAADLLASLRPRRPVLEPPPPSPTPPAPTPPSPTPTSEAPPATPLPGAPAVTATAQPTAAPVPLAIDVVPGLGWPLGATQGTRQLSLGVFGTYSAALDGVEAAGLFALKSSSSKGVQISGLVNVVGEGFSGLQASSTLNVIGGRLHGLQFSGVVNLARQLDRGAQGGIVNVVAGQAHGIQGGVANLAGGKAQGLQAGVFSVAGHLSGVQAGVANLSAGDVSGVQAGVGNVAVGNVTGVQAGVVNLSSGKVSGLQVGVLNLAEDADVGLGLLSIYWRGRTHVEGWTQETGLSMVAVKHGSKWVHNLLTVGARPQDGEWKPAVGFGLGTRVRLASRLHLDIDALQHLLFDPMGRTGPEQLTQLRALVGLKILGPFSVFAGPSLNVLVASPSRMGGMERGFRFDPHFDATLYHSAAEDITVRAWPGLTVGLAAF